MATMIKIDSEYLREVGLGALSRWEANLFLKHVYETLQMRVGVVLADEMTNKQLDEFETFFEAKDDKGAFGWLEQNFPNYKEIVATEHERLKAEITRLAPEIMRISAADPREGVVAEGKPNHREGVTHRPVGEAA